MRKIYLDTNVFSMLAKDTSAESLAVIRRLAQRTKVQVLGSIEVLGEFVPVSASNPDLYNALLDLFWDICGGFLVKPWHDLLRLEIVKGNRLAIAEARVPIGAANEIADLARSPEARQEWVRQVVARKERYVKSMSEAAERFDSQANEREWKQSDVRRHAGRLRINRVQIRDWGRSMLIRPNPTRLGLSGDASRWPDVSLLPCSSSYIAMTLVWCRKRHEAKRKYRGSDFYDSMHYVIGSLADVLVTDDEVLHHAVSMIEWRGLHLLRSAELADWVRMQ